MSFLDTVRALVPALRSVGEGEGFLLSEADDLTMRRSGGNPFDFEFDKPYTRAADEPLGWPRATNGSAPIEWDRQERKTIMMRAHLIWERDPIAKGAIKLIKSFVVGTGQNVSFRSEEARDAIIDYTNDPILQHAQFEKDLFDQLLIDGEIMLYFEEQGQRNKIGSRLRTVPLKPWNVDYIEHRQGDFQVRTQYWYQFESGTGSPGDTMQTTGDLIKIPADRVLHVSINKLTYEMRGRSELFAIMPWLRAYRDWLENRARINRYKGIIYHLKLKNATPDVVRAKQSQFNRPIRPASIYVSSSLEELVDVGQNIESGQVSEDGRQIRLMNAVGLNLPEFMLSEGQSANLATASAQTMPVLRTFADYQDIYSNMVWKPIYLRVLAWKYGEEALDTEVIEINEAGDPTGKKIKLRDSFNVGYPTIEERRLRDLADALRMAAEEGWVSDETASHDMGFDYWLEVKRGAQRRQRSTPNGRPGGDQNREPGARSGDNPDDTNRGGPSGNGYDPEEEVP